MSIQHLQDQQEEEIAAARETQVLPPLTQQQQQQKSAEPKHKEKNKSKKLQGPKRDQILDLEKYKDQSVRVQLAGNITVTGVLKSYDAAMNMILDDAVEYVADELDLSKLLRKRTLGVCVVRGTLLVLVSPNYAALASSN